MQFRVPQNITMEDRIIGTLTAIQFGILVIGGGFSFFIFTSTSIPSPFNVILGGLLAVITVVLAIGKFNDQPMYRFFRYMIAYIFTPKTRVWHKGGVEPILVKPSGRVVDTHHGQSANKHVSKHDFEQLAALVDSRGEIGSLPPVPEPKAKPKQ